MKLEQKCKIKLKKYLVRKGIHVPVFVTKMKEYYVKTTGDEKAKSPTAKTIYDWLNGDSSIKMSTWDLINEYITNNR